MIVTFTGIALKHDQTASSELSGEALSFTRALRAHGLAPLTRAQPAEVQINVGKRCNQACHHCHVDAGPKRSEVMSAEIADRILDWSRRNRIRAVDFTGGAPELNPNFRRMVDAFLEMGAAVKSRCNLTVLLEPGQEDLADWYAARGVHLICSLPCYTEKNVDAQRGDGVFEKSIDALQKLNALGFGADANRQLDLVYNPGGAFLPGAQDKLERDYKEHLGARFGVRFQRLLTLTNLPISRFAHWLDCNGLSVSYNALLVNNFNPKTVDDLMCRHLISVDWQGRVYDCDFNQMLDLPLSGGPARFLWDLDLATLANRPVAVGSHCFGCTAGSGSSCGGALI